MEDFYKQAGRRQHLNSILPNGAIIESIIDGLDQGYFKVTIPQDSVFAVNGKNVFNYSVYDNDDGYRVQKY